MAGGVYAPQDFGERALVGQQTILWKKGRATPIAKLRVSLDTTDAFIDGPSEVEEASSQFGAASYGMRNVVVCV